MKNIKQIFLYLLIIVSLVLIIKTIYDSRDIGSAREDLSSAQESLQVSNDKLIEARAIITSMEKKIGQYEIRVEMIRAEMDSIALSFEKTHAKNWDDLQRIKNELIKISAKLRELRKKNKEFE
nr:hypothetical protein [Bacteroidota bacterium]